MTDHEADFMPCEKFDALALAWRRRERRAEQRNAELVAALINVHGGKVSVEQLIGPDPDAPAGSSGLPSLKDAIKAELKRKQDAEKKRHS